MKLRGRYLRHGKTDISDIKKRLLTLPAAAWVKNTYRQDTFLVHKETTSIIGIFCKPCLPLSILRYEEYEEYNNLFSPLIQAITDAVPGTVCRAMFAKVPPRAVVVEHTDEAEIFAVTHRVHIPIISNPKTIFSVNGYPVEMPEGEIIEINNLLPHKVENWSRQGDRIHFICDLYDP
ncbi:MAG: aspartyl/asparaginyl beta-hydroxylase domain-containing protein [Rhodospirillaceae bacterium]|nr:aspartyl/asparaginyl beta-hydroxylase domain-containing protein [Rhodospirillaceae bacterium]